MYIPLYTQIKYSYTHDWSCLLCILLNHNGIYALWEKNGGTGSSSFQVSITSLELTILILGTTFFSHFGIDKRIMTTNKVLFYLLIESQSNYAQVFHIHAL